MRILVDADSCAKPAREVLEHAQCRLSFPLIYVARYFIEPIIALVEHQIILKEDVDAYLLEHATSEDLLITRDLPLMKELSHRGIKCMNDKGKMYQLRELEQRIEQRNWNYTLARAGIKQRKPPQYSAKDKKNFAFALDQWLALNWNR